jgi:hypothetical protein
MITSASNCRQGDGRLWALALGLSVLLNVGVLLLVGFTVLKPQQFRKNRPVLSPAPQETTVTIFPEMIPAVANSAVAPATRGKRPFAQTSEDQLAPTPEMPAFIGERNTQATSDRSPDASAPPLPSQAGIDRENLETTESRYQDSRLASNSISKPLPPTPSPPALPESPSSQEKPDTSFTDASASSPSPPERLLEGPNPVDVAVPQETAENEAIKPTPPKSPKDGRPAPKATEAPKPAATNDPGFSGHQRKTAIVGSISRTGRSALDVADSPLGRYQAVISRAVEQEWQRNCVRHRDFITPGYLTVRFFVETSGRVRSVQFVGDMETGEVQKGFTLNSIRDADIPAMPAAIRKEFAKEPLELIFNFYF